MNYNEFLKHCTLYGGDWTAMFFFFTGIKEVAPEVYKQMPERVYSFDEVAFIVNHLCYDRPHFRFNLSLGGQIIEHTAEGKFLFREATPEELNLSIAEFHSMYNEPNAKTAQADPAIKPMKLE